jgi:integrase
MAGLQERNGSYRILFRYQGKQHAFTLDGNPTEDLARAKVGEVDLKLHQLKQRFISVPPEMDICEFLKYEGRAAIVPQMAPGKTSLGSFRDQYVATHKASLEKTTLDGIELHFGYFVEEWGENFPINDLGLLTLQAYVDGRTKDAGMNGRKVSAATIKKEIITLRTAWNWAKRAKIVKEPFPYVGLRYPRTTEKPPFMTKAEVERKIRAGGLSEAEEADLWDAMYPTTEETKAILKLIKGEETQPFLYPMVGFAAYTGARRSEIIRAKLSDLDFREKVVTIHEKKRVKGKTTTRRVPISPVLEKILRQWLKDHPGGPHLFCHNAIVRRSKKRSPTTGHQSNGRATTIAGRAATITARSTRPIESLTPSEAHNHLKRALSDTDWSEVRGWHFFRHGFISACATMGIDQRFIEEFAGHMSEEISRRYRHLYPSTKYEAIKKVFG